MLESISLKDELGKYLSVVNYPAEKEGIISDIQKVGATDIMIFAIKGLPTQKYHTPREVILEIQ